MSPSQAAASGSSLLHLHRPAQLGNEAKPCLQVVVRGDIPDTTASDSVSSSPTSMIFHHPTRFCPPRVDPCMKVDTDSSSSGFLQRPCSIRRTSSDTAGSSASSFSTDSSIILLRSVCPTPSVMKAKPKEEWQPDMESALCNHPFCSTMFGQTSLPLGPRRHHCRLCGLIYCYAHTMGRLQLQTIDSKGRTVNSPQRVCDGCRGSNEQDTGDRRPSDAAPSLVHSEDSSNDEFLASPRSSRFMRALSQSALNDNEDTRLAPIEEWMDRSGILSLYPLAVQPSHSRRARSPSATRAAGPLFAPTISERRNAKERELERQSLRQRRNVRMWVTTPVGSDVESEYEEDSRPFRSSKVSRSDGTRTPQERELDWSTF